jgi:uncharacterized membrane-anchored protein YitT (DUF2179 family)
MTLNTAKRLLAIGLGAMVMGFGLNAFNIANNLAEGGFAGIGILLKLGFDINPGYTLLAMNAPLFFLGLKELGWKSMAYTGYGTLMLSFWLWLFAGIGRPLDDMLLSALYAGASMGLGMGVVFRFGGTTGGVDVISRILNKHFGFSMGRIILALDVVVLAVSLIYLSLPQAMYTMVAMFIGSRVIDIVQQGAYKAKALMIVSDQDAAIADAVMTEMNRGVTLLKSIGGYTRHERNLLYIVVGRNETMRAKNLVMEVDPMAFVTVHDVHEVLGEGFARAE